jgi:hypothetical protein
MVTNAERIARILEEPRNGFDIAVTVEPAAGVTDMNIAKALIDALAMLCPMPPGRRTSPELFSRDSQFSLHQSIGYTAGGHFVSDGTEDMVVAIVVQIIPRD